MTLPLRFARWWSEAGLPALPEEGRATCSRCAQCADTSDLPVHLATFDPRSKCCTYLPLLRNFQVGAILADPDPALAFGRDTVRARIGSQVACTPLGLLWPASFTTAYEEDADRDFGRRVELRCPHYVEAGGLCGIWRHRNATCSTWFCRYERGDVGRRLWRAVREALDTIEDTLMWWVVRELGLDEAVVQRLGSGRVGTRLELANPTPEDVRAAWGDWADRQERWFLEAHARVEALTWLDVRRIGGGRVRAALEELEAALEDHDNLALPPFVAIGAPHEAPAGVAPSAFAWVHGYRAYDPIRLPAEVWGALRTLEVIEASEAAALVRSDVDADGRATLRRLLDHGVLRGALPPVSRR
jgi:hypothetical protein